MAQQDHMNHKQKTNTIKWHPRRQQQQWKWWDCQELSPSLLHTHTYPPLKCQESGLCHHQKKLIWTEFKSNLYHQVGQKSGIHSMGISYFCYPLLSVVTGHWFLHSPALGTKLNRRWVEKEKEGKQRNWKQLCWERRKKIWVARL